MQEEMYAPDKPSECSKCYFWKGTRSGCSLGKGNCYYLIREVPKVQSECDGCPYGRDHPSKQMEDKIIQLLEQWQKKREKSMER